MHSLPHPTGESRTTGESYADAATTKTGVESLATATIREPEILIPALPVRRTPELLALGFTFEAAKKAELGFNCLLIQLLDDGYSVRDLAAACGLTIRITRKIIDQYGPGVRKLMKEEPK